MRKILATLLFLALSVGTAHALNQVFPIQISTHGGQNGWVLTDTNGTTTWAVSSGGGSGTVGPSTSTDIAFFNSTNTITGDNNLTYSPFVLTIGGTNPSTIYGDGTQSVIGGGLTLAGNNLVFNNDSVNWFMDASNPMHGFNFSGPRTTSTVSVTGGGSQSSAIFDISQLDSSFQADQTYSFPNYTGTFVLGTGVTGTCAQWVDQNNLTDANCNAGGWITATSTDFYPFNTNPGAYITGTSTVFYLASNPGAFITATSTVFYPIVLNPGAYITATSTAFTRTGQRPTSTLSGLNSGTYQVGVASDTNVILTVATTTTPDTLTLTSGWQGFLPISRGGTGTTSLRSLALVSTNADGTKLQPAFGSGCSQTNGFANVLNSSGITCVEPFGQDLLATSSPSFASLTLANDLKAASTTATNATSTNLTFTNATGTTGVLTSSLEVGSAVTPNTTFQVNGTSTLSGNIIAGNNIVINGSTQFPWAAGKAVSGPTSASFYGNVGDFHMISNAYFNPSSQWAYMATGTAANLYMYLGDTVFRNAASGNKDTLITWQNNMIIRAGTGNVGIGTTTPLQKLVVVGSAELNGQGTGAGAGSECSSAIGLLSFDSGANCVASGLQFKENIHPFSNGLAEVLAMKPVTFHYKPGVGNAPPSQELIGFIAQDAESVLPDLVTRDASGTIDGFRYMNYTAVLTSAIQEQQKEIDQLKAEIETLKK